MKKRWTWGTMTFSVHEMGEAERVDLSWSCSRCGTNDHILLEKGRQVPTARKVLLLHAGKTCEDAIAERVLES